MIDHSEIFLVIAENPTKQEKIILDQIDELRSLCFDQYPELEPQKFNESYEKLYGAKKERGQMRR